MNDDVHADVHIYFSKWIWSPFRLAGRMIYRATFPHFLTICANRHTFHIRYCSHMTLLLYVSLLYDTRYVKPLTIISVLTLKKTGALLNSQKRFRRYKKVSKHVHGFKNTIKNPVKPLKDRPVYQWEDPSPTKPFFKFSTSRIGFVGKYETFRVSHENLMVSY
jgi:hypothetical protein